MADRMYEDVKKGKIEKKTIVEGKKESRREEGRRRRDRKIIEKVKVK